MSDYVHKDTTRIHEYVTSPSLDASEARIPNEHGVYPINPLGFPEFSSCADSCNGDESCTKECLGKGTAAYPQSAHFSVENSWIDIPDADKIVEIGANVENLHGEYISFPIEELYAVEPGIANDYIVKVAGDLSQAIHTPTDDDENVPSVKLALDNAGYEDYSITGLFETPELLDAPSFDGNTTSLHLQYDNCRITGRIGKGRLVIKLIIGETGGDDRFVLLTSQANSAEDGLYKIVDDGPWVRVSSVEKATGRESVSDGNPYDNPASLDNSPLCGHVRHGYSDREVAEHVEKIAGGIIQNARHPMSVPGDLSGAGSFTKWFVECGGVVLGTSHHNGESVVVDGFGLGGNYSGNCAYGDSCEHVKKVKDSDITDSPVTTFSIGTTPEVGEIGLPLDWPFTEVSEFADEDNENNITLVKSEMNFSDGSGKVGGLSREVYETCDKCGGTGVFDGDPCPECNGEGEVLVGRSVSNRIHICVNSDFKPGADGKTTFKKTYVHLPAPLDTKDGDEYEVTVSLPMINTDQAYQEQDPAAALSAYYEYVSQPRVVVMGGYWKFSSTMNEWFERGRPDVTGEIVIPGATAFAGEDGDIPEGTRVRFTLDGMTNCPRFTDMTGVLEENKPGNVRITNLVGYPYGARIRDRHMKICGLAYLGNPDEEPFNYTDTAMGLHSRNNVTLGSTDTDGEPGSLSEYNKFITPHKDDERSGRVSINGDGDARQILASVYPTTTSTFRWSVIGRNRMRHLDKLMTDEWDLGENSISAMIWNSNKKLIDFTDTAEFFGYGENEYWFNSATMPTRYAKKNFGPGKSVIGSQLRIYISESDNRSPISNPVRQARKAAAMFASDFAKLRMYHGKKLPKISASSEIRTEDDEINVPLSDYFGNWHGTAPSSAVTGNSIASAAWLSKARHLPEYVIVSGQDMSAAGNSVIGANPFVEEQISKRYKAGFAKETYGNGTYGTNDGTEVIPCNVRMVGKNEAFAYRSVISARVENDADAVQDILYNDANRVAELQKVSIDAWAPGLAYDFTMPYNYLLGSSDYQKWMDIYSATANVFSIDCIPTPDDCDVPTLSDEQKVMLSGDPMVTYKEESGNDILFTATNLPFYDEDSPRSVALTNMLRKMVSPYGAKMPVRFWDGTRVSIATNGVKNNEIARLTRLEWPELECDMPGATRSNIVDDEFIGKSANGITVDVNLNYVRMEDKLHMNWSAPPVKVNRDWYNKLPFTGSGQYAGPSGYVRVFMKFKFSAQAGRWYTVDYMQAPMSYLSPLYGANTLETEVDGIRIWGDSVCAPEMSWKETLMHPYYKYTPMDINPQAIASLVKNIPTGSAADRENATDSGNSQIDMSRFETPYRSVSDGGLGISAPANVNGDPMEGEALENSIHANFWSVRKHLRPAVSVLDGTDIPAYDSYGGARASTGGTMGDSVLWGQYEFPRKGGEPDYDIPPTDPEDTGDKLILSTGEYVSFSDGDIVELG